MGVAHWRTSGTPFKRRYPLRCKHGAPGTPRGLRSRSGAPAQGFSGGYDGNALVPADGRQVAPVAGDHQFGPAQ